MWSRVLPLIHLSQRDRHRETNRETVIETLSQRDHDRETVTGRQSQGDCHRDIATETLPQRLSQADWLGYRLVMISRLSDCISCLIDSSRSR